MLSTNKLKKIKSNFPVLVGDNVVSKSICNLLNTKIYLSFNLICDGYCEDQFDIPIFYWGEQYCGD